MEERPMVTVTEAAAELGVSGAAINKRLQRGDMRGVKVNPRLWLIPAEEVERWKQRGRLRPGPKPRESAE
jgi:excisionase family DNA binding protein